jgi:vacuolar protein sorting-associated protein 53
MAPAFAPSPVKRTPTRTSSRSIPVKTTVVTPPPLPLHHNPVALLNTLQDVRNSGFVKPATIDGRSGTTTTTTTTSFDPIAFLNKHYSTEQSLAQQLPGLRDAVQARMNVLNTRISDAMQRQSETAETTRKAVRDAKSSVLELERRILQVKEKAGSSESAVLAITKDMKRLDCAKQHLTKTIATLKRLHMLVQAVEQLRLLATAVRQQQPQQQSDYKNASHLVQAIAQLTPHFEPYEERVEQMKLLSNKVKEYKEELRKSLVTSYRVTAFGYPAAMLMDNGKQPKDGDDDNEDNDDERTMTTAKIPTAELLQGGTMYIDALGESYRRRFIHEFCQDLLGEYLKKFEPPNRKPEKRVSSFKAVPMEPDNVQAGLDHIDKRFVWFHEVPLKIVKNRFPNVFPSHWNLQASLSNMFLQLVRYLKTNGSVLSLTYKL